MQLHDPDPFELKQALTAFCRGNQTLPEICNDLGIRPGPVYDEYVNELKEGKSVPVEHKVRLEIEQHAGFDRVYNDLPILIEQISKRFPDCYLYELADYEPLPDTEWVVFFVPSLGFVKLYTSLFYELGCYIEVIIPDSSKKAAARDLAQEIRNALNRFYKSRTDREKSLSHG